jgi:hypothetical protein
LTTGYSWQQWKSGDNYKSDITTAWINAPIYLNLSPQIMMMPYIAWRMGGDTTLNNVTYKQGTTTEYGIWWRASF